MQRVQRRCGVAVLECWVAVLGCSAGLRCWVGIGSLAHAGACGVLGVRFLHAYTGGWCRQGCAIVEALARQECAIVEVVAQQLYPDGKQHRVMCGSFGNGALLRHNFRWLRWSAG